MSNPDVFEEFQQALFGLVRRLLPSDGTRFFIYVPWVQLRQEAGSDSHIDSMAKEYSRRFWELDPMHPSRFESQATVVVSNSMIMNDADWRETVMFKEFYKPNGYFHNCDVFLKQNDRIVAVLTLVRKRASQPFTTREVQILNQVQPFIEYSLNKIHISNRVHNRSSLCAEYGLTAREMDVVEIALTGVGNKVLSRHLGISLPTLRTHLQRIFAKLGVRSNAELISRLVRVLK
jgi:DNA-binding CsgD family transcriptional regulator